MWFFPLESAPDHPRRDTVVALLEERFEAYKADMRARFFETHFARFDRQILLVDVLGALHGGRVAFRDTEEALALIASHLRYGRKGFGRVRQGGIERVAFVATKADHVPGVLRANLRSLLRDLVEAARSPMGKGPVSFHTVASIHATEDANVLLEGVSHDVVRGVPLGSGAAKLFNPGTVPIGRPPDSFWDHPRFVLPVFEPPRLEPGAPRGVPSLGLDTLLTALLEDKL